GAAGELRRSARQTSLPDAERGAPSRAGAVEEGAMTAMRGRSIFTAKLFPRLGPAAASLAIVVLVAGNGMAQATGGSQDKQQQILQATGAGAEALLQTPIPRLFPGGARPEPLKNPVANDPAAVQRGMTYFNGFNCAGCHAANGAGGMGRAL